MKYHLFTGRGKNALKKLLTQKLLAFVDTELELLSFRIKYPSQFHFQSNKVPPSPLYLTNETYLVEIMELVSGLFLTKRIVTQTGKESPLTEIGRTFEWLFNIKLGDIHKKHDNVICRKANKRTEFLDLLRRAIAEESKKKGYL